MGQSLTLTSLPLSTTRPQGHSAWAQRCRGSITFWLSPMPWYLYNTLIKQQTNTKKNQFCLFLTLTSCRRDSNAAYWLNGEWCPSVPSFLAPPSGLPCPHPTPPTFKFPPPPSLNNKTCAKRFDGYEQVLEERDWNDIWFRAQPTPGPYLPDMMSSCYFYHQRTG